MNTETVDSSQNHFDPICQEISKSLYAIYTFQRRFLLFDIASYREELVPFRESLEHERRRLKEISTPKDQNKVKTIIDNSVSLVLETLDIILTASVLDFQNTMIQVMKAFRKICRAQEDLYAIRDISIHLNQFFLEPPVYR